MRCAQKFALLYLFAWLLLLAVLVVVAMSVSYSTTSGLVIQFLALRLLIVIGLGVPTGVWAGKLVKSLAGIGAAIILSDVSWVVLNDLIGASIEREYIVFNPLLFTVFVVCPVVVIENGILALGLGVAISFVLPILIASAVISRIDEDAGGSGMAHFAFAMIAAAAIVTGVVTTIVSRLLVEVGDSLSRRVRKPSNAKKSNNQKEHESKLGHESK